MAGRNFLKEPAEGLKTLHAMGIMHRDLGPENMLDQQRDGRSRKFEGAATFSWFVYTLNSFSISFSKYQVGGYTSTEWSRVFSILV